MSEKRDFYGKDVTEAITNACIELGKAQENLQIDIIEAGSAGFFGFAKKQAHIKVSLKKNVSATTEKSFAVGEIFDGMNDQHKERAAKTKQTSDGTRDAIQSNDNITAETIALIEREVMRLVDLLGYSAKSEITVDETTVHLSLNSQYNEELIGEDGRVIDALQYLVRKIIGRKITERTSIVLDVDGYRKKRLGNLQKRAIQLAKIVRREGKPQIIPALNPAERREIHLILQSERGIRSRSLGDGIFRKIVISRVKRSGGKKQKSENRGEKN